MNKKNYKYTCFFKIKFVYLHRNKQDGAMVELVDTPDLKSCGQ